MNDRAMWLRLENESSSAYEAFTQYLYLEPRNRSLESAWKAVPKPSQNHPKTVPSHWKVWSSKFSWVERVELYDDHLAASRFLAEEEAVMSRALAKVLQREQIENLEVEIAGLLINEAREMLAYPRVRKKVEEKYEDGRAKITIIEPKKWTASSVSRYIELADKLLRLSVGMHTDATRVAMNVVLDDSMTFVLNAAQQALPSEMYEALLNALHPEG